MEIDRVDGRTPNPLRPLACSRNILNCAPRSSNWSQGETKVLAAVYGPKAGIKKSENPEKACIEVIWKPKTGQIGKREKEYEMILKRTLQSICLLTVNPNTTTSVIVQLATNMYNLASKHSDPAFLTVLLQDQIGGLQVLHENQWADVQPIAGSLVVNVGDLLQIISNDKFKSVDHRVLANHIGPRISVACFFTGVTVPTKLYGPIEELISEESPPVYREFSVSEYVDKFFSRALDEKSGLDHFKL